MKFNGVSGEFAFKALIPVLNDTGAVIEGWRLSDQFYFSSESIDLLWKWPVEVFEDGSVRVISEEELDEK